MSFLELQNITKIYPNGTKAVNETSLNIENGEFVVFVGPSVCGKSTLLRMIAGLEDITSGEIVLDSNIINNIDPSERDVAMVFQNYALYPHMTVYNNMAYGLKNRGISKQEIENKVNDAAKLLEIDSYLERKPSMLSGGQRQRVAMGRAIVRNPKIFLFDEPLSNLDAKLRNQMRLEIKKLQRQMGVTSIFVTHDQTEAMTLGDRIVVINNGKIVADQNLEEKTNIKDLPKEQILLVEFDQELKINALKKSFPKTKIDKKDHVWIFSHNGKGDLRKTISKYAQKNNILILEMKAHNDKLEDLFKKLTK